MSSYQQDRDHFIAAFAIFEAQDETPAAHVVAAIAAAHGYAVASRDPSAFHAAGLKFINPWNGAN